MPQDICFNCPNCHKLLKVDPALVNRTLKCPACSGNVTFPEDHPASLSQIIGRLTNCYDKTRTDAAEEICKFGKSGATALLKFLEECRDSTRDGTINCLAQRGVSSIPFLLGMLGPHSMYHSIADAIAAMGKQAAPELVKELNRTKDRDAREHILKVLDKMGENAQTAIPSVIALLQGGDESFREYYVCHTLCIIGRSSEHASEQTVAALIATLQNDVSPGVRRAAAGGLGQFGSSAQSAIPALVRACRDKSKDVRYSATLALKEVCRESKTRVRMPFSFWRLYDTLTDGWESFWSGTTDFCENFWEWLFAKHARPTEPVVGMRFKEIVQILGQGYNYVRLGDQDFYLFKGQDEHDYTISFRHDAAVEIKKVRKDPDQVYGR